VPLFLFMISLDYGSVNRVFDKILGICRLYEVFCLLWGISHVL